MKIIELNKISKQKVITEAVKVLDKGGLIIYPTETAYGVGVDATSPVAVSKLLQYKKRPEGKAISVAVSGELMASEYVEINTEAQKVYKNFLPGPITVISSNKGKVDPRLISERNTLGIRVPDYKLILELVSEFEKPITATSANASGKKTPYSISDIFDHLSSKSKNLIDLVIDAGELPHNPPSTVIDTTRSGMQVIRKGSVEIGDAIYEKEVSSDEIMQNEGKQFMHKYITDLKTKAMIVLFNGELGAGKTQFTKGMAKSLGIMETVSSPTYTILHEYVGQNGKLIHIDAWRLESLQELEELDMKQYLRPNNVISVEWAGATEDFFRKYQNDDSVIIREVEISYTGEFTRRLRVF